MPNLEIELNPVDFVTIDTIGPKGQRVFYLQAGQGKQLISVIIEKEQSWALSEAIRELLEDLDKRTNSRTDVDITKLDMALREPIEPVFRVAQMGLGYDEENDRIVLIAQELVVASQDDSDDDFESDSESAQPSVVRIWCTRQQMAALSLHAMDTVKSGRADPRQNGRLVYYWT